MKIFASTVSAPPLPSAQVASGIPRRTRGIDIYPTSRCNLSCSTCFLGNDYFSGPEMTLDTATAILIWARHRGLSDLAILGGEPSLWRHLPELIVRARRLGFARIRMVTNGSNSFHRFLQNSHVPLDVIALSIDGACASTHDLIRGTGSFASVVASMDILRKVGQPFATTTTVHRDAITEVGDLIDLAQRAGAARAVFHWLSSIGRARAMSLALTPSEWEVVRTAAAAAPLWRTGFVVEVQDAFLRTGTPTRRHDMACAIRAGSNLQFMPDGRIHQCGLTVDRRDLAGMNWESGGIRERHGVTERQIAADYPKDVCPIRAAVPCEPNTHSTGNWQPGCIYDRTSWTHSPVPPPDRNSLCPPYAADPSSSRIRQAADAGE